MAKIGSALSSNVTFDASRNPVQVGGSFQTQDQATTNSPLTVSSSIITLTVPDNAITLTLTGVTNSTRISEKSNMSSYYVLAANNTLVLEVSKQQYVYLLRDGAADSVVSFYFTLL